jgi:methylmalonyl-CoA/ethylmalonyl-CoA epimerase
MSRVDRVLFDHIAIGVPRIADTAPFLAGVLGGVPDSGYPSGPFTWGSYRFDGDGCIELIEPVGPSGFVHRFLADRGPGIHHVTFRVPSLDEACARAEAEGYGIVGRDDSDPEWKEAFLHPKQALGIVVQFAEPGPADEGSSPPTPPPAVEAPPPPVTLQGLRMRCQSRERAVTQWKTVLQGEMTEDCQGRLVFRWPGSFMRVAVEIDAVQNEGPLAIELRSPRRLALPPGAHPVLGTVFTAEEV